jgi:hypothetical protein
MVADMRAARYPLAAARTQRDLARQTASRTLAEARARLAQAESSLRLAHAERAALLGERSATLAPEVGCQKARTQQRAAELARSGAYAARLQHALAQLETHVQSAQAAVTERARVVRLAELTLTDAHAQRELVERHHERFRQAEDKALEHAHELEAEELQQRTAGN